MDRAGSVIGLVGAMILVGSAMIVRTRAVPNRMRWQMALLWAAIFAGLFTVAHWIDGRG
jgi:hypothetical protein